MKDLKPSVIIPIRAAGNSLKPSTITRCTEDQSLWYRSPTAHSITCILPHLTVHFEDGFSALVSLTHGYNILFSCISKAFFTRTKSENANANARST